MIYPDLILCRHGQSLANALGDAMFIADDTEKHKELMELEDYEVPLTELGLEQSKRLGAFLFFRFGVPDLVIDPGYTRATQTADTAIGAMLVLGATVQTTFKTDDRFRERECGPTRKMRRELREAIPQFAESQRQFAVNPYQARPIGGESVADMVPRTRQAIWELKDLYPGKTIFIFCHGHTMHAVEVAMCGLTLTQSIRLISHGWTDNCAVHFYEGRESRWSKCKKFSPLKD